MCHSLFYFILGLRLSSFLLPERSEFFDQHMITVSSKRKLKCFAYSLSSSPFLPKDFPLNSLDLTGYRNITDVGISCIRRMNW